VGIVRAPGKRGVWGIGWRRLRLMLLVLLIAGVERVGRLTRGRISGIARLLGRGMGIIWGRPRHDGRVCRKSGGEDLKGISRDDGGSHGSRQGRIGRNHGRHS
jgi:hypothetical protein